LLKKVQDKVYCAEANTPPLIPEGYKPIHPKTPSATFGVQWLAFDFGRGVWQFRGRTLPSCPLLTPPPPPLRGDHGRPPAAGVWSELREGPVAGEDDGGGGVARDADRRHAPAPAAQGRHVHTPGGAMGKPKPFWRRATHPRKGFQPSSWLGAGCWGFFPVPGTPPPLPPY